MKTAQEEHQGEQDAVREGMRQAMFSHVPVAKRFLAQAFDVDAISGVVSDMIGSAVSSDMSSKQAERRLLKKPRFSQQQWFDMVEVFNFQRDGRETATLGLKVITLRKKVEIALGGRGDSKTTVVKQRQRRRELGTRKQNLHASVANFNVTVESSVLANTVESLKGRLEINGQFRVWWYFEKGFHAELSVALHAVKSPHSVNKAMCDIERCCAKKKSMTTGQDVKEAVAPDWGTD